MKGSAIHMALKYSKQREYIKSFLKTRKDHPTADVVYMNVRETYPNISLGTVYRNLQLLTSLGEIRKVDVGDGVDHFDADTSIHFHFICRNCGAVLDLNLQHTDNSMMKDASEDFDGEIDGQITYFYGLCGDCRKAKTNGAADQTVSTPA